MTECIRYTDNEGSEDHTPEDRLKRGLDAINREIADLRQDPEMTSDQLFASEIRRIDAVAKIQEFIGIETVGAEVKGEELNT